MTHAVKAACSASRISPSTRAALTSSGGTVETTPATARHARSGTARTAVRQRRSMPMDHPLPHRACPGRRRRGSARSRAIRTTSSSAAVLFRSAATTCTSARWERSRSVPGPTGGTRLAAQIPAKEATATQTPPTCCSAAPRIPMEASGPIPAHSRAASTKTSTAPPRRSQSSIAGAAGGASPHRPRHSRPRPGGRSEQRPDRP